MHELRALRGVERDISDPSFFAWDEVLLPLQKKRLEGYAEEYKQLLAKGKVLPGESVLCDLDQSPQSSFGRLVYGNKFPTMIRHR